MKHYILSVLAGAAIALASCGGSSKDAYTIEGKVTNLELEGRTVYLQDAITGKIRYDSATVIHGHFTFTGKQDKPVVRELFVQENDSDIFPVTLPIVLENADMEVDLGDRVYVGNTSLNKRMMEVLMAVDRFTDQDHSGKSVEEIKSAFGTLLMEQIVKNANSVIGSYLYEAYQNKLTEEQKTEARRVLGV